MKRNISSSSLLLILIFLVLVWGCATQSQPTGGPKDKTPPKLINSVPSDQALNYKGKTIELKYDEIVAVKDLSALIITPRIDQEFTFRVRKDMVILIFEEALKDSTTYTFNFRNSIKDITEGNSANTILSFSTGDYLDSGMVSGNVRNLLTTQPANNAVVGLYEVTDTLNLFTGPPLYFTNSKKNGDFVFTNIKMGNYYVYAFQDGNNNLICQPNNEMHGYLDSSIVLDSVIENISLSIQFLDVSEFKVLSARQSGKYYEIKFNKYVTEYSTQPLDTTVKLVEHFVDQNKTLKIYNTFDIPDSLGINIIAIDSLGNTINDTTYIQFAETSRGFDKFEIKYNQIAYSHSERQLSAKIKFSKPVDKITRDSIYIKIDSLKKITADSTWKFDWAKNNTLLKMACSLPPHIIDSLVLKDIHFAKSAFISVEKDSSLNSMENIKVLEPNKFGIIGVTVETDRKSFIVQLLDKNWNVTDSKVNLKKVSFGYVTPGEYRIRVLFDENNNGKWDPGNFYLNILPEPVIIFKDPEEKTNKIIVRANWELGPYLIKY